MERIRTRDDDATPSFRRGRSLLGASRRLLARGCAIRARDPRGGAEPWSSLGRRLSELGSASLDLLAPSSCRKCAGSVIGGDGAFCGSCLEEVEWIANACARCGSPALNPPRTTRAGPLSGVADAPVCGYCHRLRLHFDRAAAGGKYTGALRTAVLRFKFRRDPGVLPLLATAVLRAAASDPMGAAVARAGAIVPVPTHFLKRWWRGWDPVDELAQRVATDLAAPGGLPVLHSLRKVRWTPSQVSLPETSRRRNLRDAFRVRNGSPLPSVVVLIDDVLTTGTTASECALALKRSGVPSVLVLAAARS